MRRPRARYVADGYLCSSGNFIFRAEVMLRELARLEPEIRTAAKGAVDHLTSDLDFYRLAQGPFAQAPKKSIDYAVMERTALAAVLPVSFRWSDIGSWNAVWDAQEQDSSGNVIEGPAEVMNTSNSLIRSEETVLTTVIGLDGVIVIATADAVLVVARQHAERVKDLVEQLKAKNRTEAPAAADLYACGHCFSGQPPPFDALVPSNVASHKPEEWDQCSSTAAQIHRIARRRNHDSFLGANSKRDMRAAVKEGSARPRTLSTVPDMRHAMHSWTRMKWAKSASRRRRRTTH
jgi:Mannose-6-phosphate isomerase/Nucleotidyl transferase